MPDEPKPKWELPATTQALLVKLFEVLIIAATIVVTSWVSKRSVVNRIDESDATVIQRIKKSENLVQKTVKEETGAVAPKVASEIAAAAPPP